MTSEMRAKMEEVMAKGLAMRVSDIPGCCFCPIELGNNPNCYTVLSGIRRIGYTCTKNISAALFDYDDCGNPSEVLGFDLLSAVLPQGLIQNITFDPAKDKTLINTENDYDIGEKEETNTVTLTLSFCKALSPKMLSTICSMAGKEITFVIQDKSNKWWINLDPMTRTGNSWTSENAKVRTVTFEGMEDLKLYPLSHSDNGAWADATLETYFSSFT